MSRFLESLMAGVLRGPRRLPYRSDRGLNPWIQPGFPFPIAILYSFFVDRFIAGFTVGAIK